MPMTHPPYTKMRVTVRDVLVTALENLKKNGFKKFQAKLCDIDVKERYRKIPRSKVEDKDQSDVADLIRTYYKDVYGVEVTLAVLDAINEKLVAEELCQDLKKVDRFVRLSEIEEGKSTAPTARPVMRSLCHSGELRYSLTLERFYPAYLHFKWTCGEEKDADIIPSQEHYTEHNNLFTVRSEVIIPQNDLKGPESTVNVQWEHEYTNSTGHEKICINGSDFPWRPAVGEIQLLPLFLDTPVTLLCDISGYYPDAVSVTWLRRNKDNQEICEDSASTEQTSSHKNTDNTYSCTAKLTITPILSVHQGAEYICRVQHPSLQRAIEKRTERLIVMGKPQMQPVQMTLVDNMFIRFCLTLKRFYPKNIKIRWYREEKRPRKGVREGTIHTETVTEDDDLTFCVTSECQVWGSSFADPQYKLYVTWEHPSLDRPETRALSVRDFPWNPTLGKINVPTLKENQKSTLRCNISGYFPNVLTVTWLKREKGKVSVAPASGNMATEILPHKDMKALFGCTAILHFTPKIDEDQGSEFICRVEHPSLEQPREISTGPLEICTLFK